MLLSYSRYGAGFDAQGRFSLSDGSGFCKNAIILGADVSSSVHIDYKKKDILVLVRSHIDGLDDSTSTAGKEYSISSTEQKKKLS